MLDFEIEEAGSNLSVGQKQVICIMRAFLRVSKSIYIFKRNQR